MAKLQLQPEEVHDFLQIAAQDPSIDIRLDAIATLSYLPLSPSAWCELASIAEKLLWNLNPQAPQFPEAVRICARIPVRSTRMLLAKFAADTEHPAALLCATELARHRDPAGVERLLDDLSEPSLQLLASLPLERLNISPAPFAKALADPEPMVRFWASLALARLGEVEPLEQWIDTLLAESEPPPPLFGGDPWTPYQALAAARPLPANLHNFLVGLYHQELGRHNREALTRNATILLGGLTGVVDAEGEALLSEASAAEKPQPSVDPTEAETIAEKMLTEPLRGDFELNLDEAERSKLVALSKARAGEVMVRVLTLTDQALQARRRPTSPMDFAILGNTLLGLASALPKPFTLPLAKLVEGYARTSTRLPAEALSWVLARSGAAALVGELGPRLLAAPAAQRSELLGWAKQIACCLDAPPPFQGAGPGGGEPPVTETVIENLHRAARARAPETSKMAEPSRAKTRGLGTKQPMAAPTRTAWPHLFCQDRVAVGEPFPLEVGLGESRDPKLEGTGAMTLPSWDFSLEVELLIDSAAFVILEGERCFTLDVTKKEPYPVRTLKLAALGGDGLRSQRRIGVSYVAEGILRGYAARELTVGDAALVPAPEQPAAEQLQAGAIDLAPSIPAEEADLTISIRHGDDAAGRTLVFSACSPHLEIEAKAEDLAADIGTSPDKFTAELIRKASASADPLMLYDWLHGRGRVIAGKLPPPIRQALALVVAKARSEQRSASVLIISEDPHIPWELAVIEPPLLAEAECASPFLGAQVALGRWVLSPDRPSPRPPREVHVRQQAIVSGRYEGVPGWKRLQNAEEEAKELALAWPPAQAVDAFYPEVRKCLQGKTLADSLHFALHGQFDASGLQSGLVLLSQRPDHPEIFIPQFLEADHVRGGNLQERKPFVFLNACQVAGGQELLGDYAGMASAFLYAGAAAVVAPLWSIDDGQARAVASGFYASAYQDQLPPAEILRRERARYCEAAVEAGSAVFGTHLAYQFFGHPRLLLQRAASQGG